MPSHLTAQINQQFDHLEHHHRRRQLLRRWATDPALAGRTPRDIVEVCEQATLAQNGVIAALIRHHQAGDPDAATVLLVALRPMLKAVIRYRHQRITDDLIDNYWAAASHLIGDVDPDTQPADRDGYPVPFVAYLGSRLQHHVRQLDPSARRWNDQRRRGDLPIPIDVTSRSHELVDGDARGNGNRTEDVALARVELTRVADAVRAGTIPADRWRQLVEHRLGATATRATGAERVAVHRTATRLAELVGHAA